VKCKNCGLFQILEVPSNIEEFYLGYRLHSHDSPVYRFFRKVIIGHSYPFMEARGKAWGKRLLDIGCGNGWYLKTMEKKGWQPFGYEFNKAFAQELSTTLRLPVFAGEELLTEYANYFDLVTFNSSFEHLNKPRKVLELVRNSLRKGGKVIIAVPNPESREARLFKDRWFHLDPPRHISLYNKELLSHLLKEVGFNDIQIEDLAVPTGFAGSISYKMCGVFSPLIWYINILPGMFFCKFIRDGYFRISASKV
jgi:SAM-dependent methyltransferase